MYFEAHPNAEIKHREEKKKHEHHKEEKKVDEAKVVEEKVNGDVKHTEHSNETKVEAVNNAEPTAVKAEIDQAIAKNEPVKEEA